MDAFGGSSEDSAELRKLLVEVVRLIHDDGVASVRRLTREQNEDSDSYETWEKLVRACESLEGGINRNSSSQAITAVRDVYDRFLAKFPLFFGYWKKYADLEFAIAGTEAADMVSMGHTGAGARDADSDTDLRTRCCKRHKLCRSMDQLLFIQNRNKSRCRGHKRVSIGRHSPLPTYTQSGTRDG